MVLVEKIELQAKVEARPAECWSAYTKKILALQPAEIIWSLWDHGPAPEDAPGMGGMK